MMGAIFRCTSMKAWYNGQNSTFTQHINETALKSRYYTIAITHDIQHVTATTFWETLAIIYRARDSLFDNNREKYTKWFGHRLRTRLLRTIWNCRLNYIAILEVSKLVTRGPITAIGLLFIHYILRRCCWYPWQVLNVTQHRVVRAWFWFQFDRICLWIMTLWQLIDINE